ncbi:hypothetical protein HPB50_003190 [Hyalomma asiaticum]|uniref:Uncharacterized protein n=1 Tax=Hyalomma asiaticum TaxID=266040 RepID=A0ACB7RXZ8_HYAAI|nr:hypothetical protein HPB50_003190 [Hyalomma asiaticum]
MRKIIAQIRQRFSARSRNVCYVIIALLVLWVGVTKELEFLERVSKTRLFFHKGYVLDTPGCRIPDYDPLHWTVRAYYHNRSGLWKRLCDESGSLVTFTNRSTPVLNERVLEWKKATAEDITCAYAEVLRNMRNPSPDNATVFGPWRELKFGRPLRGAEYIVVRCNKIGAGQIFERYAFLPRRKSGVPVLDARARRRRLNVLVLGMDSVSRISTVRHMPLTRRFLMQELNAFEFVGYNKVGFASFHNQIPLLTGIPSYIVHGLFSEMFFDSLPHLMSVYRKRGYRTLFLEEYTACGLFTYYQRLGFKKPPTDYYPRAIMQKFIRRPTCSVLRYVQDLLSFDDQLLFAYLWLTDLVHEDFNGAGTLDAPLVSLLRNLSSSGVLKRTALVLISDHGMRFGRSRRTEMGRIEDRTPTFFLALPEHFLKKHPEAAVHLQDTKSRKFAMVNNTANC